ncbi:MAG TPA: cytochrome c [Candidatus Latescibacteria bacterium]|jgi:mono/diheme cytochrome c family protein|nr:cytochrome c [Candidatus Latescibacterota bacterium]HJN26502.1 cytochrome c [Candidatus Latescibacterota bacterium]
MTLIARPSNISTSRFAVALVALTLGLFVSGCDLRQRMYDQEKYEPHEATTFFKDGLTSRAPIEGTVARGGLRLDTHLYEGKVNGELATTLPPSIEFNRALLERGQERFNIYCTPCHDRTGSGNGVVVQRGLKQPPSLHQDRLRNAAIGYYYDVITNGFGSMFSYASRIPVNDRWAVAAYIRALQFSQEAAYDELPAEDQRQLQ